MKCMVKGIFSLSLLLSAGLAFASCPSSTSSTDCTTPCGGGYPYFAYRSQSINAARDLVGWQDMINKFEMEGLYGAVKITPEYTRTFKPERIAGFFFGDDLQNGALTVSGSRYATRGAHDWLADYFGLPTDFKSTVKFTPRIQNFMADMSMYLGLDEMWEGAWFRIHAPIVWTKWELNMCETIDAVGTLDYDAGYMDAAAITYANLPAKSFEAAMKGVAWGDVAEAMKYGKIDGCKHTKTRLSDIELALGWNFMMDEDYHFGLAIRGSFPTGNKPEATYLFEPIVGSGGHWMLGGNLTGHVDLWTSDDEECKFAAYLDANLGHYFRANQTRSFDLKNRKNSRYMLVSELGTPVANLYAGTTATGTAPSLQYQQILHTLINKTTFCTDVSIALQGDAALKFAYTNGNFTADLGYSIWGRSGEKFKQDCCTSTTFPDNKYALKGDAFVIGFERTAHTARALSATESLATINAGTNTVPGTTYVSNPRIDNATAAASVVDTTVNATKLDTTLAGGTQTNTSLQPVTLTSDDINMCETPSALSHKVFGNLGYTWRDDMDDECDWVPFIGIGGEVEFGAKTDNTYSAASQWGVWVEGGLSFD